MKYLIGTLFEEEEQNKKTNINNMKAKDPNGNVRWKGAFTGGFEAGYKNTCGSKQGWAPAQFVSSVAKRAQKVQQNVLDYMDKEDIGRQSISTNIALNQNFTNSGKNGLNIRLNQSIGEQILEKHKKQQAFEQVPQNQEDLQKLFEKYAKQQEFGEQNINYNYNIKDHDGYFSLGSTAEQIIEDDFIANYEDFFKKVIRNRVKEETQEQITKRRQQNKVYFDFTKPLQEQPQYLREIHDIETFKQPRKRRKNVLNQFSLKDIFTKGTSMKQFQIPNQIQAAPQDYDPYYRIRNIKKSQQKQFAQLPQFKQEEKKFRVNSIRGRSDLLGQTKLSDRFRSSSNSTNFVRAGQEQASKQIKKYFEDEKKNARYVDYVQQRQGKKISAQLQYLDWQQAEKQKAQFEKLYKMQSDRKIHYQKKQFAEDVEKALKKKSNQITVTRTIEKWKPQKLLCKRFNVLYPC